METYDFVKNDPRHLYFHCDDFSSIPNLLVKMLMILMNMIGRPRLVSDGDTE